MTVIQQQMQNQFDSEVLNNINEKNTKERMVDMDNLQSLCIYIVYSMKYSYLIADYFMINDFVSKNVELSSRNIFLGVLKGGIDYLLNSIQKKENEQEMGIPISKSEMLPGSIKTDEGNQDSFPESTVEEKQREAIIRKSHSIVLYSNHPQVTEFNFNKQPKPAEYDLMYENSKGIYLSPRNETSLLSDEPKA